MFGTSGSSGSNYAGSSGGRRRERSVYPVAFTAIISALALGLMAVMGSPDSSFGVEDDGSVPGPTALEAPPTNRSSALDEPVTDEPVPDQEIRNLRAFAKLYGYVRYFHPSDAAAETNWDAFVVHGARQVIGADSQAELRSTLNELFAPIAPTVQLYETGDEPPAPPDVLTPTDTPELNLVAWQHRGLGLGNRGPYESTRLHRAQGDSTNRQPVAQAMQGLDATPHRGKQVRLDAAVKTDTATNLAHLWLAILRPDHRPSPEDLYDSPISTENWTRVQSRLDTVAKDARQIAIGATIRKPGTVWIDHMELSVRDSSEEDWTPIEIINSSFEDTGEDGQPAGWRTFGRSGAKVSITSEQVDVGERSLELRISPLSETGLFDAHPAPGEVVNRALGRNLSAQIPLALYSRNEQTLRPDGAPSPKRLYKTLDAVQMDELSAADEALRFADLIIAWSTFQHFYPYFGVVDADWDQTLTRSLRRAEADSSSREFLRTLRRMLVPLKDGHGRVSHPADSLRAGLPLQFDLVEEKVVVADTVSYGEPQTCVRPGDVLASLDGTPIEKTIRNTKRYISGSPQWRTVRALRTFDGGPPGTTARLTLRRDGQTVECQVPRADSTTRERWRRRLHAEPRPDSIDTLSNGTHYVDLTRVEMEGLRPHLDTLSQAAAVVFDVRGYPEGGAQELLRHLSPDTLRSAHFEVPKIIYPDRRDIVGYSGGRWTLPPKSPQFTGEVAFLTDARAISYAESIMGIVEHYDLGTIVGQPTAGANGNINPLTLPGEYDVYWTGMRVQKHDRSQHHLIGIRPDVHAERTIDGVRSGTDEVLRTAMEVIGPSPASPSHR